MKFLRNLLATLVGLIIFSVLAFFILIGVVASVGANETVPLTKEGVLRLRLSGPIVERAVPNPFADYLPFPAANGNGLLQLKQAINQAKEDPNIKGIILEPSLVTTGWATLRELRQEIIAFQQTTDKFVVAYGEILTEGDYYLASAADEVYFHPEGNIEFNGLSSEVTFIKGVLEKIGVEPQIFRVGTYKSAVEPLMRKDMSEASREQMQSYLNSMYDTYLEDVAANRGIEKATLMETSNKMLVRNAEQAVTYGLVDGLKYFDELLEEVKTKAGFGADDNLKTYSLNRYLESFEPGSGYSKNRIAVIVGTGGISGGSSTDNSIGSDDFAREIRKARNSDKVKAIVIRINSPGGSALASDVIWREVKLAAAEKPVIASMGDVAASGGYYIAMGADKILAQPNTITGSIGIFGVLFNAQELLNDKIGVTTETVNTGELSGLFTLSRPLTDFEKSIIQTQVEEGYETFTSKAAEGRGMKMDDLLAVASGRVWSGSEALARGLVDELGSLEDAIAMAAEEAGVVDDYSVRYYPEQKDILEEFLSGKPAGEFEEQLLQDKLGAYYPFLQVIREAEKYQGIQARLPYEINIH